MEDSRPITPQPSALKNKKAMVQDVSRLMCKEHFKIFSQLHYLFLGLYNDALTAT
jgi:hypothetical protein